MKDVIEQYTTGHVEVLGKVKNIGNKYVILVESEFNFRNLDILHHPNSCLCPCRIDEALGYRVGTGNPNISSLLQRFFLVFAVVHILIYYSVFRKSK